MNHFTSHRNLVGSWPNLHKVSIRFVYPSLFTLRKFSLVHFSVATVVYFSSWLFFCFNLFWCI